MKSVVAITKGERWEAKRMLREALDLIGGLNTVVKKGDAVMIKPNQNYPALPGMPQYTSTTDGAVIVSLTELLFEAGARKVVVGESHMWGPTSVFVRDGIQEAIEKAGTLDSDTLVPIIEKAEFLGPGGKYVFQSMQDPLPHQIKYGPGFAHEVGLQFQGGPDQFKAVWPPADGSWNGVVYKGVAPYVLPPWTIDFWKK